MNLPKTIAHHPPYPTTGVSLDSRGWPLGHTTGVYEASHVLADWLNELPPPGDLFFFNHDVESITWAIIDRYLEEIRRHARG